ncbi:S-adenosyl-L-methionine-dependent methyltransferase [Aspergillus karnatakaensis]|uniref:S-adenosyl-L-methionine-dependent methyltransferase n=1 Tax=Aspergillus karnatakaensis TaxID=1810916 RepID=UPI003CCD61E1
MPTNGINGGDHLDTDELINSIKDIDSSLFAFDGDRIRTLRAAYALVSRLETSWDTVARLVLTEPALGACLKIARDLELFERWHEIGESAVCTAGELAKRVGCDEFLLSRILRHLVATNLITESSPGSFQQSAFSKSLLKPVFGDWVNYLYDATLPCFYQAPEFLAKTGYQNPTDPNDGIFQYTKDFKGNLFDYYNSHEKEGRVFNNMMGGVMAHQAGMLDIYPFERLDDGQPNDSTTPLLVDVGGNVGHDMNKLLSHESDLAPRLVLQDRGDVIALAKCPTTVQKMVHDFFTAQPVMGARAYYLHGVIHDWADPPARIILSHLRGAMRLGYSKLLVHDHVLPDKNPHPQATAYDLTMMVKVSAFERTEAMWVELLGSVGFRVVKIWSSPLATQSVIEAEPR